MRLTHLPLTEDLRLQDLYTYNILDTAPEKDFDELLDLVSHFSGCKMAAISFLDQDRQWFKATKNLPLEQVPRNVSFCAHTILQKDVLVVHDTKADARFCSNPFVAQEPSVRFYAGASIVSKTGYALGTVCVLDQQPRLLTPEQESMLRVVSAQIAKLLELRLKNKVLKTRASELLQTEKELLQKTLEQQEEERFDIGTELHENIAQSLAATKIYLEMAEADTQQSRLLIQKSKACIADLIVRVRALSQAIVPSTLKEADLRDLLVGLRHRFCRQTGIGVHLSYKGNSTLRPDVTLTLYRIVEEQLENVRQHARASEVWINVNAFQRISLTVRDNGIGIKTGTLKKGTGLNNMLTRIERLGGVLDITGRPLQGCSLTVHVPATEKATAAA